MHNSVFMASRPPLSFCSFRISLLLFSFFLFWWWWSRKRGLIEQDVESFVISTLHSAIVTQLARTLPRTTKLILHKHRKKRAWAQNLNLLLNSRVTNRSFVAVSQLLSYSAKYCAKVILYLKTPFRVWLRVSFRSSRFPIGNFHDWHQSYENSIQISFRVVSFTLIVFLPLWKMNVKIANWGLKPRNYSICDQPSFSLSNSSAEERETRCRNG